jgi:hypothetical protein
LITWLMLVIRQGDRRFGGGHRSAACSARSQRFEEASMTRRFAITAVFAQIVAVATIGGVQTPLAAAATPPPAPAQIQPAAAASVVEPFTLRWDPVVDPDGPIASYTWEVGTSSTFTTIIASGFTQESLPGIPVPTQDTVSGLPLGSYFWRVKATQTVGGAQGAIDSAFSTVRSFSVTGLGAVPGVPSFTAPATGTSFHAAESFDINWTAVSGAQYYLLEADDEPTFSYPLTLTTDLMQFGTHFRAGWGNELPNVYYRIRAVSAAGVRGLPSATLNVKITNTAPSPPAPTLLSPVGGAARSFPITFDWTDTPNPQPAGYDLDIDDEPTFAGTFGVFLVQNVSRSDYMMVDVLAPGTYFWRVRALHGLVPGPWSAGGTFTVVAGPPIPAGLGVLSIVATPSSVSGGNSTQARVTLTQPAPAGGVTVQVASDMADVETPASVFIPAGATDAMVSPITTRPVPGATVGTIRAAYGASWQMSSLGLFPLLWGHSLGADSVIGGASTTGSVTLLNPAPSGGAVVTLVSADPAVVSLPSSVFIPAGGTGATFNIATSAVSAAARVRIDSGLGAESYHSPAIWLTVAPPGSPAPPAALQSLALTSASIAGGDTTTGTVTLTAPAPAGGATVRLSGSMEGQVVVPQNVTVPAGSTSASFTITAPVVPATYYVLIQASLAVGAGAEAKLLEIRPGSTAATLAGFSVSPLDVVSGSSTTGTVQLVTSAPAGGGVVALSSSNPALLQVPPTVTVPAGNNSASFPVTTSATNTFTTVQVDASAGGITRSEFVNLAASATAPSLVSFAVSPTSVTGGTNATGTVALSAAAPAGGVSVTLSTGNSAVQLPPVITVPAGQSQVSFTVTTTQVSASTPVTLTAFSGSTTRSTTLTVTSGSTAPGSPTLLSPANAATVSLPVTLDWNDVPNAASYEIQVDDSSAFSAPLVLNLTSTASQTTVTGLTAVQHWWRVRAKTSAGVLGNFSASRSFTPAAASPSGMAITLSGVPATIARGQSFTATATVTNGGASAATGTSVVFSFTPTNALRLTSPTSSTQSAGTVAAGGTTALSWQTRADSKGTATVTMTLRSSAGVTLGTATRTVTITN